MAQVWKHVSYVINLLSEYCGATCNIAIAILSFIVFYEVIVRYFFLRPTIWSTQLSEYLLSVLCFIGASHCLKEKGHIKVDLFVSHLSSRTRQIFESVVSLIALIFCAVLAWQGYLLWHEALTFHFTSGGVWDVPLWIPYIFFPIGMVFLCFQYIVDVTNSIIKFVKSGREF